MTSEHCDGRPRQRKLTVWETKTQASGKRRRSHNPNQRLHLGANAKTSAKRVPRLSKKLPKTSGVSQTIPVERERDLQMSTTSPSLVLPWVFVALDAFECRSDEWLPQLLSTVLPSYRP